MGFHVSIFLRVTPQFVVIYPSWTYMHRQMVNYISHTFVEVYSDALSSGFTTASIQLFHRNYRLTFAWAPVYCLGEVSQGGIKYFQNDNNIKLVLNWTNYSSFQTETVINCSQHIANSNANHRMSKLPHLTIINRQFPYHRFTRCI